MPRSLLHTAFSFGRVPFSALYLLTILVVVVLQHQTSQVKVPALSTYLPAQYYSDAWSDLQAISQHPHPFNSHANDEVYNYLIDQLTQAISRSGRTDVELDAAPRPVLVSKSTDFHNQGPGPLVYYIDSNNVLMRIPGSDPSLEAVMINAHFDGVSTSFGTTDAGYGVAAALASARYILDNPQLQLQRTVIVNLNNAEEPFLGGAHGFMTHAWSNSTGFFINLEGTGSGYRPMLFRTSDYGVAQHFTSCPNALGNSMSQQGFESGLIASETDYSVYVYHGMRGLDIAFFEARARYHTQHDSIQHANIGSLSYMVDAAVPVLVSMANETDYSSHQPALFFDTIAGFHVFALPDIIKLNLAGLILGPLLVDLLLIVVVRYRPWVLGRHGWGRGIAAFASSAVVSVAVAHWTMSSNREIAVSHPVLALVPAWGLNLVVSYTVLGLFDYFWPVYDQKLIVFVQQLVLYWLVLLACTVVMLRQHYTGLFLPTILYFVGLMATVVGLVSSLVGERRENSEARDRGIDQDFLEDEPTVLDESNVDERTTLLDEQYRSESVSKLLPALSYDWSLQFFVLVPTGLYFVYSSLTLMISGVHQTPLEGDDALVTLTTLYSITAIALGTLAMPFIHRVHSGFMLVLVLVLVLSGVVLRQFPFTVETPLRGSFTQIVDLDHTPVTPEVRVRLLHPWSHQILSDLPSIKAGSEFECKVDALNMDTCTYIGPRPYVTNSPDYTDWMTVERVDGGSSNAGPNYAELEIRAPDNRVCVLSFETESRRSPVRAVTVTTETGSYTHTDPDGIDRLALYKLAWDGPHRVGIEWVPSWYDYRSPGDFLDLQVECMYGEFEREINVGGGLGLQRRVPALDELHTYSPEWVGWAKMNDGLVTVRRRMVVD